MIRDNREATQALLSRVETFLSEACHCTTFKRGRSRFGIFDAENNERIGAIEYSPNYASREITISLDGRKDILHSEDSDMDNVKKVAMMMNSLRITAGVQCEDWDEVKATLGI